MGRAFDELDYDKVIASLETLEDYVIKNDIDRHIFDQPRTSDPHGLTMSPLHKGGTRLNKLEDVTMMTRELQRCNSSNRKGKRALKKRTGCINQ